MTDRDELLRRHQPRLYYDAQEAFFADSAATWTDAPGNVLRRGFGEAQAPIAAAGGDPELSLDFLASEIYGDGSTEVRRNDTISDPSRRYRAQAAALHEVERYANRIYGHAVTGSDGRLWLQYWFFYFYNDFAVAGFGLHEGDWEMIQLRLDGGEAPDLAVYAQHKEAEQKPWRKVAHAPDDPLQPIVYVARGSHASYFSPGSHWTGVWFDQADGRRRSANPATLEIVGDDRPSWIGWPGSWGDTRKPDPRDPFSQESPRGPSQHAQWRDPVALVGVAAATAARRPTPRPPSPPLPDTLEARRVGDRIEVDYVFGEPGPRQADPETLVVTLNSRDDRRVPATFAFPIAGRTGTVSPEHEIPADQRADVHVSAVSADGVATAAIGLDLEPGGAAASWIRPGA